MAAQFLGVHFPAGLHAHEAGDDLAPSVVRQADHGDLRHIGVLQQRVLDFGREQVLAAPDNHLLHPPGNAQIALPVERAEVARMQPAVGVDGVRRR